MAAPKQSMQDRRTASRDKVILSCRLIFDGTEHDALIKDISTGGTLLQSDFLPPANADISVKIETTLVSVPLILEGKILRRSWKETEHGPLGTFGIEFKNNPPKIMELISELANPQIP